MKNLTDLEVTVNDLDSTFQIFMEYHMTVKRVVVWIPYWESSYEELHHVYKMVAVRLRDHKSAWG